MTFEIKDLLTLVALLTSIVALARTQYIHQTEERKRRAKEIETRLNEFYSPLLLYMRTINHLYCEFRNSPNPAFKRDNFRTINHLLDGNQIFGNEGTLLSHILDLESKVEKLLIEKSGHIEVNDFNIEISIDSKIKEEIEEIQNKFRKTYNGFPYRRNSDFRGALELLLAHIHILRSAANGTLVNESARFSCFTYPKALDAFLEERINALEQEHKKLNKKTVVDNILFGIEDED